MRASRSERHVRAALRRAAPPGAERAHEQARDVVLAAYRPAARRSRSRLPAAVPVAVAIALALGAAAVAATPPGDAVRDWVRDLVTRESAPPRPEPSLARLPSGGRLLVTGPGGAWVVDADGSRRRLGPYRDATWSPRGLFVGAVRDRQLLAVDPRGTVRWALARPEPVHDPRWAPSGFRIAYRSGAGLRVVAGDGSADRLVAARVAPVAAAWRPGSRHELAYLDRRGDVVRVDVDLGRVLARLDVGLTARKLQWSPGGRRLLVSGPRRTVLLRPGGDVVASIPAPRGTRIASAALSPAGDRIALLRRRPPTGPDEVLVVSVGAGTRRLFSGAGPIRSVTWAPDGRRVLADWAATDQWLFLPAGTGRPSAVSGIAAHFDPGRARPRAQAHVAAWCC